MRGLRGATSHSVCCLVGQLRRGVIVDNPPTFGQLSEDNRRHSAELLPVGHPQMPTTTHQRSLGPQHREVQLREVQCSHLLPLPLVLRTVAFEGCLPSACLI